MIMIMKPGAYTIIPSSQGTPVPRRRRREMSRG